MPPAFRGVGRRGPQKRSLGGGFAPMEGGPLGTSLPDSPKCRRRLGSDPPIWERLTFPPKARS
eukprot:11665072-Alexandrium_andersonii.AAC.1